MNMPQELQFGELLHHSGYKPEAHATFTGTYRDQSVIIKCGDSGLRREEAVLQAVNFDGIPRPVAYLEENGRDTLVMQQILGVPLSRYVELDRDWRSRKLSTKEAVRITDGLARCFEALHTAGYLYRDLNLGHVLVSESKIGLVDHERCVRVDHLGNGTVDSKAGTWETMSPEEFKIGNTITQSSNVYTLGTVLLQLATGESPFFVSPQEVMDSEDQRRRAEELHKQFPAFWGGSGGLDRILLQALQPEPNKRYQSLSTFRVDLHNLI